MKKTILTVMLFLCSCHLFSQNYIYKGDNKYPSTNTWEFDCSSYMYGELEVTVAKTASGGYLMLSISVPLNSQYLGGTVYVYLMDGNLIKCTDKGIRDHVNGSSIALYVFTKAEIEQLKLSNIQQIRFTIKEGGNFYSGDGNAGNYTAENKKHIINWGFDGVQSKQDNLNYFETGNEITQLFE